MEKLNGIILKGIGGFYYVEAAGAVYECKARGHFRNKNESPLAGDNVVISVDGNGKGAIEEIMPRKNSLIRPPVSNIDNLYMVVSTVSPAPNLEVIDKLIAVAEKKGIEPIFIITKTDLKIGDEIEKIYRDAGFKVFSVEESGEYKKELIETMKGKKGAFCGNSGAGKSTLLNKLFEELDLQTNDISIKLGRGKHTTRQVEFYRFEDGIYIADTPGFSFVDINQCETILKDELPFCFREFEPYLNDCRFRGCSHTGEKDCAVKKAVEEGKIPESRYRSYLSIYESVKNIKQWQL